MLGSKEIGIINNSDIYETYHDFFLSEQEREEKLEKKNANDTEITKTTR